MRVQLVPIQAEDADVRLDRWFRRRWPGLGQGRLEKLLRTGQVRVDGKRVKAAHRLATGQVVRVPPAVEDNDQNADAPKKTTASASSSIRLSDQRLIQDSVLYEDDDVIVLNKPPGLATQGGTGTTRHLDGLLRVLSGAGKERPRLVHRLDKDTSGVCVVGRTASAAAALAEAFRSRQARKVYWALVVGYPDPVEGSIRVPLAKVPRAGVEKVEPDLEKGQKARTDFRVLDTAGRRVSWVHLEPLTGRTHQLRVHCMCLETPILGDGKYGGAEAHIQGDGVSRKLHLHARALWVPHPSGRGDIRIEAPLPDHMARSFDFFGFHEEDVHDPFTVLPPVKKKKN